MSIDPAIAGDLEEMDQAPPFKTLISDLTSGLNLYWETAGEILAGCGVTLTPPTEGAYSLRKNFFSTLFLYS